MKIKFLIAAILSYSSIRSVRAFRLNKTPYCTCEFTGQLTIQFLVDTLIFSRGCQPNSSSRQWSLLFASSRVHLFTSKSHYFNGDSEQQQHQVQKSIFHSFREKLNCAGLAKKFHLVSSFLSVNIKQQNCSTNKKCEGEKWAAMREVEKLAYIFQFND